MPWLFDKVEEFVKEEDDINKYFDVFVKDTVTSDQTVHEATVKKEWERKVGVKEELENQAKQREEAKKAR